MIRFVRLLGKFSVPVEICHQTEGGLQVLLGAQEERADEAEGLQYVEDQQGPPADHVDDDDGDEHTYDLWVKQPKTSVTML